MRYILYLLVASNVLYLGWNLVPGRVGETDEQPIATVPDGVRTLVLLEESVKTGASGKDRFGADKALMEEKPTAVDEAGAISEEKTGQASDKGDDDLLAGVELSPLRPVNACKILGPFDEPADAKNIMGKLSSMGFEPVARPKESKVFRDYWIYLPGKGPKQARKAVRLMKEKKVRDFYVYSDNKYLVSLGTFKTNKRVEKRLAELKKIGIDPVVEKRYRTRVEHWLDLQYTAKDDEKLQALVDATDGLQMITGSCNKVAAQ
jgi:hypothetical protein